MKNILILISLCMWVAACAVIPQESKPQNQGHSQRQESSSNEEKPPFVVHERNVWVCAECRKAYKNKISEIQIILDEEIKQEKVSTEKNASEQLVIARKKTKEIPPEMARLENERCLLNTAHRMVGLDNELQEAIQIEKKYSGYKFDETQFHLTLKGRYCVRELLVEPGRELAALKHVKRTLEGKRELRWIKWVYFLSTEKNLKLQLLIEDSRNDRYSFERLKLISSWKFGTLTFYLFDEGKTKRRLLEKLDSFLRSGLLKNIGVDDSELVFAGSPTILDMVDDIYDELNPGK